MSGFLTKKVKAFLHLTIVIRADGSVVLGVDVLMRKSYPMANTL
jgi:hypothetical protein